ncbi:MAG: peptidyl-prolyl cis-trans isomerase [Firmicutes bacterium]|nr:peptidyl-prolyl cis-trans isomerase [Bacillota bacterium]
MILYKNVTVKAIVVAKDPNAAPIEGKEPAIDEFANTIKKEIDIKGKERIDEAFKLLKQGEQFGQVQYDYSEDPDRREFVLNDDMYDESVREKIYALNKGEYTDIIEYDNMYYIFYAKEAYQKNMDEISAEYEEQYVAEKKDEIYRVQNDSWVNAAEIKRNTPIWDSVAISFNGGEQAAPAEETAPLEAAQ